MLHTMSYWCMPCAMGGLVLLCVCPSYRLSVLPYACAVVLLGSSSPVAVRAQCCEP